MKYTLLALSLLLAGCVATPVKRTFPEVPQELKVQCADLKQTENTDKLSVVLSTVIDNYASYHECKIKMDSWIEWYGTQKKIFDDVN